VALAPTLTLLYKAQLEGLALQPLQSLYAIDGLALIVLGLFHAARSSDWRAQHAAAMRATWRLREVEQQTDRAITWLPSKPLFKRDLVVDVGRVLPLPAEARARFEHDAALSCALHSPNVAGVFDFGLSTRGEPYVVREHVEGHSFERLVGKYGAQIPERTLYLLGQACHGLLEASEHGLVHGALTPSSLWIVQRGAEFDVVKLLNFAQQHWPTDSSFTATPEPGQKTPTTPAHTPDAYRAPERVAGKFVPSFEADVYALGCIGYWLFAGRPPFIGDADALERHHAGTQAPTLSQIAGLAPPKDLELILHGCLAKNPSERPTIAVLRRRLLACAAATHWNQGRARDWWQKHPPERRPVPAKLLSESRFTIRSLFGDE
jgi:eukaryotic-like serine/threonine-protein kinase